MTQTVHSPPRPSVRTYWRGAAAALAAFLFVSLLTYSGALSGFDRALLYAFRTDDLAVAVGGRAALQAMRDVTALGSTLVLSAATLAAALILVRLGQSRLAAGVIASVLAAQAVSWGLKHLILRARPDLVPHLADAFSASFPSGHSFMSAVVWLSLAGIAAQHRPAAFAPLLPVLATGLVALIGLSRVYLGVHWPSDVLAGWALGGAWTCASLALAARHATSPQGPQKLA